MTRRKPLRHVQGRGWEVLIDAPFWWILCGSQEEAEQIAGYEALCRDVFAGVAHGEEVAARLEAMAAVVVKYIGPGTAERYIRHAIIRAKNA